MSSAPLRARSPFFSFDAETGGRRPTWVVFLAGLVSVVLGLAGLTVGVAAANAHNYSSQANCFGLTLTLTNYNNNNGGKNTVSVKIGVGAETPVEQIAQGPGSIGENFGSGYTNTWNWDASVAHTYTITVRGHDGYNYDKTETVQPCATPLLTLEATTCNATGGSTTLTATVDGFVSSGGFSETYTATLFKGDDVYDVIEDVQDDADGILTWTGAPAGATYKLVVTGDQHDTLTASKTATTVACPQLKDFAVTPSQCDSTTDDNSKLVVTAKVAPGRAYTVVLTMGGTPYATQTIPVGNTDPTVSLTFEVPQSAQDLVIVMTDDAAPDGDDNKTRTSESFDMNPCPAVPNEPDVVVNVCTSTTGSLSITVTLTGLVPGRSYEVYIGDTLVDTVYADQSDLPAETYPATPGTHTVKVVDTLVGEAKAKVEGVVVKACPTQPEISFSVDQCNAPGQLADITAHLSNLGIGRSYTVTITGDGSGVPGYLDPIPVTSDDAALPFDDLQPGVAYLVTIVDDDAPVSDAASVTPDECPLTPDIDLELQCLLLEGDSLVTVTIDDLEADKEYTVTIEDDSAAAPTAGGVGGGTVVSALGAPVDSETVTGGPDPSVVTFQVPNNLTYTVTVTQVANPLITNSKEIFAAICDLPTFPLPPDLPTLALTGTNTTVPMLGALGLVQFGVALLALAAMLQFAPQRRRA